MKDLFNAIARPDVDESAHLMRSVLAAHRRERERRNYDLNLVRARIALATDEELPALIQSLPTDVIQKLR